MTTAMLAVARRPGGREFASAALEELAQGDVPGYEIHGNELGRVRGGGCRRGGLLLWDHGRSDMHQLHPIAADANT